MKIDFLQKYEELKKSIPVPAIFKGTLTENCYYSDYIYSSKNSLYCFEVARLENCIYCTNGGLAKNIADCDFFIKSELCYECVDINKCYNSTYLQDCSECRDCHFSFGLYNCSDCFGCAGLSNKKYCLFNKQYDEVEYEVEVEKLKKRSPQEHFKRVEELKKKVPHPASHQTNVSNSPYGDFINDSSNCYCCFDTFWVENSGYIFLGGAIKYSWDLSITGGNLVERTFTELCYELFNCGTCYKCTFLENSDQCTDCHFSSWLDNCKDCFGCVGLTNKRYCILNNQLTKEQYEQAVLEIKRELNWPV